MAQLRKDAESRDFKPVSTGITIDFSAHNSVKHLSSANVVGVVRGHDSKLKNEYVALSAHWDHLGIGVPVNGDSIYNGAVDNASRRRVPARGRARGRRSCRPTRRSLIFLFVTAEESGLLGSQYFGEHPDGAGGEHCCGSEHGCRHGERPRARSRRAWATTSRRSARCSRAWSRPQGLRLSPDAHPEAGHFYRSDHFSFAKVGIPSVSIGAGEDYVGKPKDFGREAGARITRRTAITSRRTSTAPTSI